MKNINNELTVFILGNNEKSKTIESLKKQIYKNINVVELNDDSLNNIKETKSEFFTVLPAGDTIGVDFYRELLSEINNSDCDVAVGNIVYKLKGDLICYNLINSGIPDVIEKERIAKFINEENKLSDYLFYTGNKIYKTSLLKNIDTIELNELGKDLLKNADRLEKFDVEAVFHKLSKTEIERNEKNNYYSISTIWNNELEKLKEKIIDEKTECVSFDVFDTLILRPFLEPTDELRLLNRKFNSYFPNGIGMNFNSMRMEAEGYARKLALKKDKKCQEITLDQIYDAINIIYDVDKKILNEMKKLEIQNELEFCYRRKTSYTLYSLAHYLKKKVIVISDMYLSKSFIKKMIEKCGYTNFDNIYVSSEYNKTKASGELYTFACKDMKIKPENVLHIGDNWTSDYYNSSFRGLQSAFLPRTINLFYDYPISDIYLKNLSIWEDTKGATYFIPLRCMLALVANYYFDNPFVSYNRDSLFNGDLKLIGYYAFGMSLYGFTKWFMDDVTRERYDRIQFMARDGYIPMQAYNIMSKLYDYTPKAEYFYASRKVLIPILFASNQEVDKYKLIGSINIFNHTPDQIIKYLGDSVINDRNKVNKILRDLKIKRNENFDSITTFNLFITQLKKKLYNKEYDKTMQKIKKMYKESFDGKTCTFDIGYSCRPEIIISKIVGHPIDAYFFNVNEQIAYENALNGNIKLKTFYDYKPVITGSIREMLISKTGPSCVKYDCSGEKVMPVFESYKLHIDEENFIRIMQDSALKFVSDMVEFFGNSLNDFEYYKSYTSFALDTFINSPTEIDKKVVEAINFEDDVGLGKMKLSDILEEERKKTNQIGIDKLVNPEKDTFYIEKYSKWKRFLFYLLFDKKTFKRRMTEIKNNMPIHRILYKLRKK